MKLIRWIGWQRKFTNGFHPNTNSIIESQESFRSAIIRERYRVDRNQHIFSLLLFNISKQNANGVTAQQLASLLAERIRLIDKAGWFDNKRIGVILPYTYAEGAYKVADEICKSFKPKTSAPKYTVHTYPLDGFSNGDSPPDRFEIVEKPDKQKKKASLKSDLPVKNFRERKSISGSSKIASDLTEPSLESQLNVEPFFVQPFPLWKRIIDLFGSLFGLVILSPILLLVALIIKVFYGSPVIFKQQRVGYLGRIFTMWKFRTMKLCEKSTRHQQYMSSLISGANDESSAKVMAKIDCELPITGFGRILRAMSLDELPQLMNVLRGEMTLIGPRPPTVYEVEQYLPWYRERFGAVPGMTGLWQVSGKNKLTFLEMIRLDIRYARNLSPLSDLVIFLKTPLVILNDIVVFLNLHRVQSNLKGLKNV